jgi:hypothetical protein
LTSVTRSLSDRSSKLEEVRKYSAIPKLIPELQRRVKRLNALRTLRSTATPDQASSLDEAIQKELDGCLEISRDIISEIEKYGILDLTLETYQQFSAPQMRTGLPEHERDLLAESGFSQEEITEISIFVAGKGDEVIIKMRERRKTERRPLADQVEQARRLPPQKGPRIGPALEIVAGSLTIGLNIYAQLNLLPTLASVAGGVGLIGDGLAALGI